MMALVGVAVLVLTLEARTLVAHGAKTRDAHTWTVYSCYFYFFAC
jgi:hypothetical protein